MTFDQYHASKGREVLMKIGCFLLFLAISAIAGAQDRPQPRFDFEQWKRDTEFRGAVLNRAREIAPRRRDAPMRELNLTDDEVREIQVATKSWLPNSYLNISPVVTGCPCEDGPGCKEQVYILADAGDKSAGLMLSRIRNEWKVGDVQKWWLRYAQLLEAGKKMDWLEYQRAELKMAREFPVCSGPGNDVDAPKTAHASEARK
jgi:hypothetical protein